MRVAALVLLVVALAATADARFADTQGFSGKHGVTCVSCHFSEAIETGTAAMVRLEGLPSAWDPSAAYEFRVVVEGGPIGNPVPDTPQAGFDLEVDLGTLAAGPGMENRLRFPSNQEATYSGAGTFLRAWNLVWTAPSSSGFPQNATFWVGGLAANGNHIMDGPNVTGERGDRAAAATVVLPPSAAAVESWENQPLPLPVLHPFPAPGAGRPSFITGVVADFADGAELRLDGGGWSGAVGAPGFSFPLPALDPGHHVVDARTVWRERASDLVSVGFDVEGDSVATAASAAGESSIGLWVWLLLLLAVPLAPLILRFRR